MYETERLTQELFNFHIDIRNIVINQILMNKNTDCSMCKTRQQMQGKYISQIHDLFEDFHIVMMPLKEEEIRGAQNLYEFGKMLINKKE
jgi:arsenite-transporting ATPase